MYSYVIGRFGTLHQNGLVTGSESGMEFGMESGMNSGMTGQ